MSICSRAVDGLLMSKNSFVLIIRYLEDFKVWNLNRFSMAWSGGDLHIKDEERHILKCQIKVIVTESKTLILHEWNKNEGGTHKGQEVVTNRGRWLSEVW